MARISELRMLSKGTKRELQAGGSESVRIGTASRPHLSGWFGRSGPHRPLLFLVFAFFLFLEPSTRDTEQGRGYPLIWCNKLYSNPCLGMRFLSISLTARMIDFKEHPKNATKN